MKKLLLILILTVFQHSFAQTELTEKDAFAFFMKAYNHKPNDKTNVRVGHNPNYRWFDLYLYKFHNQEYQQVKNDEFKNQKFANRILNELKKNINKADNNLIYYQTIEANLGKYNFSEGSFPVYYNMDKFKGVSGNLQGFRININEILNKDDVNFTLPMQSTDAEKFINSRKKSNGQIDRSILLKFYFKVTSLNTIVYSPRGGVNGYNKEDLSIIATKIEVFKNDYSNALYSLKIINQGRDYTQVYKAKKEEEFKTTQQKIKDKKSRDDYNKVVEKMKREKEDLKKGFEKAKRNKNFKEGLARIQINEKYGFINTKGQVVIPPLYDRVASRFESGLAWVKRNGKYGFVNTRGKVVIPIKYDNVRNFLKRQNGITMVELNRKQFYINLKGQCVKDCN
ncbi:MULTISPECIES: DUF4852 domain-containing protein [Tenacibaculum]|uniref:DUF4852 domain-containing protein n=1 Tax=Tenacibaculum TaxID=104267 RepID=UPI001F0AC44B|nr:MULTISPECIES: DUF4852 domain-containing protein [Tenacibaculum]MCH3882975.1 DUF4852 domain-containing protein [Tenacibaculum aquimarinum]MCH3885447.1 DUF4852 domain-containing protein [Tenacibaculum aquimarinum]MDO6600763.1 DUF4852 domain-containing protein [Tenacibaculum sp. 1_MG-2023]